MGRIFEKSANKEVISLLDKLVDKKTESKEYAQTMYKLGNEFGNLILEKMIDPYDEITLACTVEDADYLGRGIIDVLEGKGKRIFLTVFWNKRFNPGNESSLAVAPIIREFHEEGYKNVRTMIIIKSVISNSCVVRTNLTRLIEESNPSQILIVAPVLLNGAIKNLENEFEEDIIRRFEYLYFAEDDKRTEQGFVDPGIGGDVYQRLGFESQAGKNRFTPEIVKERRYK
jgi:hypothetical protein